MTYKIIAHLFIALSAFATCSCIQRQHYVFMGDHGTQEIKRSNLSEHPSNMIETSHVGRYGSVWSVQVDTDPERLFWLGPSVGGNTQVVSSDFDGMHVREITVLGMGRLSLDPHHDRIVYESSLRPGGMYELRSIPYDYAGVEADNQLIVQSENNFSSLQVNPDNCGKIFWVHRFDAGEKAILKEFDMKTGQTTDRISSTDFPFLIKHYSIAMDPKNHHLYWSQNWYGSKDDLIGRVNYVDGSGMERWISNTPGQPGLISYPAQIALDYQHRLLYWADMNRNWIARANMDGANMNERDLRLVAGFPGDMGPSYPNYHPTSLAYAKSSRKWWCLTRADELPPLGSSSILVESTDETEYELPESDFGRPLPFQ